MGGSASRELESANEFKDAMHRAVWAAIVPFCVTFAVLCIFGLCYWWLILFVVIPFYLYRLGKADARVIAHRLAATRGRALVANALGRFGRQMEMMRPAWLLLRPAIIGVLPEMFADGQGMAPAHEHAD